jgi:hypothetical protein
MTKSSTGALVVTTISPVNAVLKSLAQGAGQHGLPFFIIGDTKSPKDFHLPDSRFLGVEEQRTLPFRYAKLCPERSYARKNIGYLLAAKSGADWIAETDDDNFPRPAFWGPRDRSVLGRTLAGEGWVNAYAYFTDKFIYPRGFPLESARGETPSNDAAGESRSLCLIQQGLADENPDVDAVYRMLYPLPFSFREDRPLILGSGQWCPFNSQNTTFFREVFPLLYLPANCSFRMTDIWRSFVAQRILWENGMALSFHSATVWQERNAHNLLRDFQDEVPGYLNNAAIAKALAALKLPRGINLIPEALRACYAELIKNKWVGPEETNLLEAWLHDLASSAPQTAI